MVQCGLAALLDVALAMERAQARSLGLEDAALAAGDYRTKYCNLNVA